MSHSPLRDEILGLPADERLQLVEDIWDSLAAEPSQVPVPDWHKQELDRRLDMSPGELMSWDEVHSQLFGRD